MAETALLNLSVKVDDMKKALEEIGKGLDGLAQRVKEDMEKSTAELNKMTAATDGAKEGFRRLSRAILRATEEQKAAMATQTAAINNQTNVLNASLEKIITTLNKQTQALARGLDHVGKRFDALAKQAEGATDTASKGLDKVGKEAKKTNEIVAILDRGFQYLKWTLTRVFYFGAILKFQEALMNVAEEGRKFEQQTASLMSVMGGNAALAEGMFWNINDLAREINFSVDEMVKSSLILNKTGLAPTKDLLRALGTIATATGQSMFTQATALSAVVTGNLRGLRQMGIAAKDNGKTLLLTYQGQTTEIEKTNEALQRYIINLANTPAMAGILAKTMGGVTGETKQLSEAWGDLSRQIFISGGGNFLSDLFKRSRESLDRFTESLKSEEWIRRINAFGVTANKILDGLTTAVGKIGEGFEAIGTGISEVTPEAIKSILQINSNAGILTQTIQMIGRIVDGLRAIFRVAGEAIGATMASVIESGKKLVSSFATFCKKTLASVLEITSNVGKSVKVAVSSSPIPFIGRLIPDFDLKEMAGLKDTDILRDEDVKDTFTSLKDFVGNFLGKTGYSALSKAADREGSALLKQWEEENKKLEEQTELLRKRIIVQEALKKDAENALKNKPVVTFGQGDKDGDNKGSKGGGGKSVKAPKDTWTAYYENLLRKQESTLPKAQQIEQEHLRALAELHAKFQENKTASEEQYLKAKEIIEKEYADKRKKLEEEVQQFMGTVHENDVQKVKDKYDKMLEKLKAYHEQGLIEEDEYQQALQEIRDKYGDDLKTEEEKAEEKAKKKAQQKALEDFWGGPEEYKKVTKYQEAFNSLSTAFSNLTANMDKSSVAYRAMFAVQKSFAFASASVDAINAWVKALADPGALTWAQRLANYASAVATTTAALGQLMSISMHDKGGTIAPGQYGIVGEIGPELVRGPATVTSRRDTAELLSRSGDITVNLIEDAGRAGQVTQSRSDEQTIIEVCVANIRRGGDIADAISNTYGVARQGV